MLRCTFLLLLYAHMHFAMSDAICVDRLKQKLKVTAESNVSNPEEWKQFFELSALRTASIMPDDFVDPNNLNISIMNTQDPVDVLQSVTQKNRQDVTVGTHSIRCATTEACSFAVHEVTHNYYSLNMAKEFDADPSVTDTNNKFRDPLRERQNASEKLIQAKRDELKQYQLTLPPLRPRRASEPAFEGRTPEEKKLIGELDSLLEEHRLLRTQLSVYKSGPSPGRLGMAGFWNRDEFLSYNELFADLAATLDANDPRVITHQLNTLGHSDMSEIRSFTGTATQGNWNPYATLDKARKFIGATYLQKTLSTSEKKRLIRAVFNAAKTEIVRSYSQGKDSEYLTRYNREKEAYEMPPIGTEELNNRLIQNIQQQMSQLP